MLSIKVYLHMIRHSGKLAQLFCAIPCDAYVRSFERLQLGQLRLNPPGLGSKYGKRVERFSDFGKYKGNFRNNTTSLPAYRTLSKWGKWVDRLSDFGKYKGYIRNHSTSLPAYRTLSQVRGGSTSADLAVMYITFVFRPESRYLDNWQLDLES